MLIRIVSLDSPSGVQSSINEVNSQVNQVDILLASADPSSDIYTSLTSLKTIMQSLVSALSSYLALLQTRRSRFKRASGKTETKFIIGI